MALSGTMLLGLIAGEARAIELREAVQAAMSSNPEINQAVQNKQAIEFERRQAQGLYGPRISVDASAGARRLENDTRRSLDIADDTLYPIEGGLVGEQVLIDFGRNRSELDRQASRTDGAAHRVEERSEFIALNVARHYIDYLLQQRIVAASQDNVQFHERLATDLREGVTQGSISIADQQQAEERLQSSRVRLTEALQDQENAAVAFHQVAGMPIGDPTLPPDLGGNLPQTVDEAVDISRDTNPLVLEALADIDAAAADVRAARAELYPRVSLEGRVRAGDDIDGFKGRTEDYLGRVLMTWDIFDSGINRARVDEMNHRESEQKFRLHEVTRQAEADVRTGWNRVQTENRLVGELEQQQRVSDNLLISYREQFNVGRRSLLDVLDAQNTRYNVQVQTESARLARIFAEYQVLAATNRLLEGLGVAPPSDSVANARERYRARRVTPGEVMEPRIPYGPAS